MQEEIRSLFSEVLHIVNVEDKDGDISVVGLGIVAAVISIVLKPHRPELAIQISIITGVIIFVMIAANLSSFIRLD